MNKHSAACLVALTIFNCTAMMCSTASARENFRSQESNRPTQAQPQPHAQPNRSFQQPQSNRFGGEQQARAVQEQAVRGQEEQARQFQQAALRQQQDEARRMQQQAPRQQQEQGRMVQQPQQPSRPEYQPRGAEGQRPIAMQATQRPEQTGVQEYGNRPGGAIALNRPIQPRAFTGKSVPIGKAISMPVLEQNVSAAERQHAQTVTQNLQRHLIAVPGGHAPSNFSQIRSASVNSYLNNYPSFINNRRLIINRQNTFINNVPQYEYPYWWHPSAGWCFSNSFTLGSLVNGLDWLRWGWHPYYGPLPDGFVCATDYVPTPWIYFPAYGLWRQPGIMGWAPSGPPFNYSGPISVEVLEPRHVSVNDPYTGMVTTRIINVPYFYNAYFNPQDERWGYTNRHGYFVLLNL